MTRQVDVAIIGAGIVGLAHAWAAARRGLSVALFERHPQARGASVRNFGMVWPIGQPPGALLDVALRSRERWLELGQSANIWVNPCGSLHLAHAEDEWAVLEEFANRAAGHAGYACRLLTPAETVRLCPAVRAAELRGALASDSECCVDPRQAIARLPHFLAQRYGVELCFATPVRAVEAPRLVTAAGAVWRAERIVVCSGADFETLFPEVLSIAGLRRCKLQMMRTVAQPGGWRLGPHIAGGLTLCHYAAFQTCPSRERLQRRFQAELPHHVALGIHVMAAQNEVGEVVIGDSHEYEDAIDPFDKPHIDELILSYLRQLIELPDGTIAARWHGIYAKHPTLPCFEAEPQPGVAVFVAPGGAGMTLSFGLAEAWWAARG